MYNLKRHILYRGPPVLVPYKESSHVGPKGKGLGKSTAAPNKASVAFPGDSSFTPASAPSAGPYHRLLTFRPKATGDHAPGPGSDQNRLDNQRPETSPASSI